jgi:hypothetical protein
MEQGELVRAEQGFLECTVLSGLAQEPRSGPAKSCLQMRAAPNIPNRAGNQICGGAWDIPKSARFALRFFLNSTPQ